MYENEIIDYVTKWNQLDEIQSTVLFRVQTTCCISTKIFIYRQKWNYTLHGVVYQSKQPLEKAKRERKKSRTSFTRVYFYLSCNIQWSKLLLLLRRIVFNDNRTARSCGIYVAEIAKNTQPSTWHEQIIWTWLIHCRDMLLFCLFIFRFTFFFVKMRCCFVFFSFFFLMKRGVKRQTFCFAWMVTMNLYNIYIFFF